MNAVEAFAQQDLNLSDFYAIDFVARLALGESFFFGTKVYFCESLNIYFLSSLFSSLSSIHLFINFYQEISSGIAQNSTLLGLATFLGRYNRSLG